MLNEDHEYEVIQPIYPELGESLATGILKKNRDVCHVEISMVSCSNDGAADSTCVGEKGVNVITEPVFSGSSSLASTVNKSQGIQQCNETVDVDSNNREYYNMYEDIGSSMNVKVKRKNAAVKKMSREIVRSTVVKKPSKLCGFITRKEVITLALLDCCNITACT